jgi:cellobiose phosphorylase
MDACHEHLATEFGLMLCDPPFRTVPCQEIRAVLFNPGTKENSGIFCHPQGWAVISETILGRGSRAYEYYRAYMPAAYNDRAEVREIEPYVHCQSTHGRYSRRHGASRLPWLSGTATWSYVAGTQHILGIKPDWDGLRIRPVIPASWDGFSVTRRFRGATYKINVKNPNHVEHGVTQLSVAGASLPVDAPLPVAAPGSTVEVDVVMG